MTLPYRNPLQQLLSRYEEFWLKVPSEKFCQLDQNATLQSMRTFLDSAPSVFERSHRSGHFTGSALVTTPSFDAVLLTLHGKLGKWLQLGGHADGDVHLDQVALREAEEESGLCGLRLQHLCSQQTKAIPFDLDIHLIPARRDEPEHYHYDVRFVIVATGDLKPQISAESKELRWFKLDEARRVTQEESMLRQFAKLEDLARSH